MRRTGQFFRGVFTLGATLLPGASLAQDGGVLLTFGFENRLELSRNESLSIPAAGTEIANVTLLSFGLITETALDRLEFGVTGGVIALDDDTGSGIDFGRSALTFAYHREVPSAALDLSAEYRTDDVGAFGDDLADADETGTRSDLALSARLETGRTSSVGLVFGLGYDQTDFTDATDPDLVDSMEWRGDVAALLRFSEVATGSVGVRYRHREEEDLGTTTTDAETYFVGLDYAISERADLAFELGYTDTDTEEFDVIERTRGPDASLRLSYDMPVGTAFALLSVATDADEGQRETFEIGRDLETERDTISARLGVTHGDEAGTDLIGSLDWIRALPDGSIGLSVERSIAYDADDDVTVTDSVFSLNWTKNVSETSTILFDVSYELSDSPTERIEQVSLDAGLNHMLTEDWSLSSGVGYTVRRDAGGRAESPSLFVALSRDFQIRP
jgi:hypothetical protein